MLDLHLAIAHHLLIFALFGLLVVSLGLTSGGVSAAGVRTLSRIDPFYGVLALAIIAVGFSRAVFAAKGWAYYQGNPFFWAKVGTFAVIGALSAWPTIRFLAWRRAQKADPEATPAGADVRTVRALIWGEVALFFALPAFAAAMARGYGN